MIQFPDISPIAFEIGPLPVRWYGLAYLVGIALGWFLLTRRASRAAGAEWDLIDRGVTPADINWLVLGLTQPAVRAAFTFFILIWFV